MKSAQTKKSLSQLRIIGGDYRRRLVSFVDADGLRPTPDRLRETLFNWLQHDLPNATVLDCCAGSGVLGFEALSRGAKLATLIEPNLAQYRQLLATAQTLNIPADKLQMINATAQLALPTLTAPYDIILLDPPYSLDLWQPLLNLIKVQTLLQSNTLIYIEADRPHEKILANIAWITAIKNSKVGQVYAGLYQSKSLP